MKYKGVEIFRLKALVFLALISIFNSPMSGQLVLPPKFEEGKHIKKIIEHTYSYDAVDSIHFSREHSKVLTNYFVQFFDREGNLTAKKFYKEGELTSSKSYMYEENRLVYEVYDTLLNESWFSRAEYNYIDNKDYVEVTYYQKDGQISYSRFKNDANGNEIMEASLNSEKQPIYVTKSIYNENDKPLRVSTVKNDIRINERIYIYDEEENIKKVITISQKGDIINQVSYTRINDHEIVFDEIDNVTKEKKESRCIEFKNQDATIHKTYLRSHYKPKSWFIKEYVYEFYD